MPVLVSAPSPLLVLPLLLAVVLLLLLELLLLLLLFFSVSAGAATETDSLVSLIKIEEERSDRCCQSNNKHTTRRGQLGHEIDGESDDVR